MSNRGWMLGQAKVPTDDDLKRLKDQVSNAETAAKNSLEKTARQQLASEISTYQKRLADLNEIARLEQEQIDIKTEKNADALQQQKILRLQIDNDIDNEEISRQKNLLKIKLKNETELSKLKGISQAKADKVKEDKDLRVNKKQTKQDEKELKAAEKLVKAKEKLNAAYEKKAAREEKERNAEVLNDLAKGQSEITKTAANALSGKGDIFSKFKALSDAYNDSGGGGNGLLAVTDALVSSLATFASKLNSTVEEVAGYQLSINTRLQGYVDENGNQVKYEGEGGLSDILTKAVGVSPYVQLKTVYSNLSKLVGEGISYNVEQRAFLETLKDDIASTFSVENATLRQIVRVQQSDSTAARLGEEAALNSFLNSMYQTTEYLTDSADSIESAIYGATSQLNSGEGVAFDYEVQKWLGSLYSVGMSSSSISSIASALNMLGTGDVSGLASNSGMQNLLVMASARSGGKNYAELLADGLDASDVNTLMKSMVTYLGEIATSTANNKVVASQYANVFGLTISDLTSVSNLVSSTKDIYNTTMDYEGAIDKLNDMADSIGERMSTGNMMTNVWANIEYGIAEQIAESPAMYATWKAAGLLNDTVGGIAIPYVSVVGSGVDLETTVADLMQVGTLGAGVLSGIGTLISSLGSDSAGGFSGSGMLKSLGVSSSTNSVVRGSSSNNRALGLKGGTSVSASGYVGNSSGSDIYDSTLNSASDQANSTLVEATANSSDTANLDTIQSHIVDIHTLLESVITGLSTVNVKVANYGLTVN